MNASVLWTILAIVFFIIEGVVPGLVSLWFGIGAIFALFSSFLYTSLVVQIIVFIFFSVISLIILRKFAKEKFYKKGTDFERLIGHTVTITEKDENSNYRVYLDGKYWIVKSQDNIELKDKVEVIGIEGNRLIVKKIEN